MESIINETRLKHMSMLTKASSKQEGQKKFGVPDKKAVYFPYKRTAFLSGTPNFFGPSYFEAALAKSYMYI